MLQNNPKNVHFLVKKVDFQGQKILDPILGHPVYQFLPKPEFSDFTVSGSGLPMGHRY